MILFKRKYYGEKSDEELVALYVATNDSFCLGILYTRYGHLVLGTCMKYLRHSEEAEDTAMLVFEKLPARLLKHDIQHFKSWLYRVTKNDCLQLLRKKNYEVPLAENDYPAEENNLDALVVAENKLTALEEALPLLKGDQRACVELFYLHQLSYQAISEKLDMHLNAVKSAVQNGKRNLKIRLEERDEFK
jgi:RNA polymerase sigma-70 factor (ECF subfamily)